MRRSQDRRKELWDCGDACATGGFCTNGDCGSECGLAHAESGRRQLAQSGQLRHQHAGRCREQGHGPDVAARRRCRELHLGGSEDLLRGPHPRRPQRLAPAHRNRAVLAGGLHDRKSRHRRDRVPEHAGGLFPGPRHRWPANRPTCGPSTSAMATRATSTCRVLTVCVVCVEDGFFDVSALWIFRRRCPAHYEALPIFRAAMDAAVRVDRAVQRFPKGHKYALGTKLRDASADIIVLVARANRRAGARSRLRRCATASRS